MIILIMSENIEAHEPVHLFKFAEIVRQKHSQLHQRNVIQRRHPPGNFQQRSRGQHMDPDDFSGFFDPVRSIIL